MAKAILTQKDITGLRAIIDHHEKEQWLKEQRRLQRRIWAAWLSGGFMAISALIEIVEFILRLLAVAGGGSP